MKNNHHQLEVSTAEIERIELRSEEVREILGAVPHWTIRSGSTYLLLLVMLALGISWFIQYPDIVRAPITVTTQIPPAHIIAQNDGYLSLWVKDNQPVREGQYLGFLKNTADVNATLAVMKQLDSFKIKFYKTHAFLETYVLPEQSNLGEVQTLYNTFFQSVRNYQFAAAQAAFQKKAKVIAAEISGYEQLAGQQNEQSGIMANELKLARQMYERDSILYEQKVISRAEFEQKQKEYLSAIRAYKNNVSGVAGTRIQATQLSGRINELRLEDQQRNKDLLTAIETSMNELDAGIKRWEQLYMLKSPIAGRVALFSYWTNNQFIKPSDEILTVIPGNENYFAKAKVPVVGSGKIKPGQKVNIKLDNFPYQEYGIVSGQISGISLLPRENNYNITINLPAHLPTSYGKQMEFRQEMSGTAEIITEDLRLIERVFYEFKKLLG
jgi:multidrug resistance efflux pump